MKQMHKKILAVTSGTVAILFLVCTVLPLLLLNTTDPPIAWIHDTVWLYLSVLAFVLAIMMPFVVFALYAHQIKETGVLGFIGLVLSLIGFAGYLGLQFDMTFVWPVLAMKAPELVDFEGPMFRDSRFAFVHFWMGPVHTLGMLLLGISFFRARVFPRTACVLLTIALILSPGALLPPFLIRAIGGVLGALGFMWIAFTLWPRTSLETAAT
jgi:hypothetical protein